MSNGELRDIRGGVVSYVFQEPGASLNPVFRIGNQIKESLKLHRPEPGAPAPCSARSDNQNHRADRADAHPRKALDAKSSAC